MGRKGLPAAVRRLRRDSAIDTGATENMFSASDNRGTSSIRASSAHALTIEEIKNRSGLGH